MGWHNSRLAGVAGAAARPDAAAATSVKGIDVADYQGNVNWSSQYSAGIRFAYVKATEGGHSSNSYFAQQYNGSYKAGMTRGAYHFALPNSSGGKSQADVFISNGGGWSNDGRTLPGALDIEYNPYGATCYGLSASGMVGWIKAFSDEYRAKTGRDVPIYSTLDWWKTCTGNSSAFGQTNPLWIAHPGSSAGTLPAGWGTYTFWQYSSANNLDRDYFNGSATQLKKIATG